MNKLSIIVLLISIVFPQNAYELNDGTIVEGNVVFETETKITLQTKFGEITILKSDILIKTYTVVMNSGEKINGKKIFEDGTTLILKNKYGEMELNKINIKSITENFPLQQSKESFEEDHRRPRGFFGDIFGGKAFDKDSEFSIGEEKLISLFFDPTGHTLDQGTLYLSGLSFGFGVTDRFQVTTKWGGFFWGDMNIRPKLNIFNIGNWEKEHSISIGAHYHTRWWPNKFEWKSGSVDVTDYESAGEWVTYEGDNECPTGSNSWTSSGVQYTECWLQGDEPATVTKYYGGFYRLGDNSLPMETLYTPDGYDATQTEVHYNDEPYQQFDNEGDGIDEWGDQSPNYYHMVEFFTAYTFSKARDNLKGRTSHTLGAVIQYVDTGEAPTVFYRYYYGLDIDINPKLKMISEIFYDPNYLELWQKFDYEDYHYYEAQDFSDSEVKRPEDVYPVHLDFGFIYAFNESFRFGLHFQQPFVSIYWKF